MPHFYLYLNGEEVGPFSGSELAARLTRGELTEDVPARAEDAPAWSTLGVLRAQFLTSDAPDYRPPPPPLAPGEPVLTEDEYLPPPPPPPEEPSSLVARSNARQHKPIPPLDSKPAQKSPRGSRLLYYLGGGVLLGVVAAMALYFYLPHPAPASSPAPAQVAAAPAPLPALTPANQATPPALTAVPAEAAPAQPDDETLLRAIGGETPTYLELKTWALNGSTGNSYRFTASFIVHENLYVPLLHATDLPAKSSVPLALPTPLPLEELCPVHAPGDPLFNTGRFTAEKVGVGWNVTAVEFDSDWRKLGLPKDRFAHDPAVLYDAKTDDPRVLSDWSKQVEAYRQVISAPPAPSPASTESAIVTPAPAPAASSISTSPLPTEPTSAPDVAHLPPAAPSTLASTATDSSALVKPPPERVPGSETVAPALEPTPPPLVPAPAPVPPEPTAPEFQPGDLIANCTTPDPVGNSTRFDSLFRDRTYTFHGTVARLNRGEGLVVFRGGGVYPNNWDLQISSSNPTAYGIGRSITVRFRLTEMIVVPFGGISFRGDHLHHKSQP